MNQFSADTESGIDSELIDLGTISMTALRELDGTMFRQALGRALQQVSHPQVTVGGGSGGERID